MSGLRLAVGTLTIMPVGDIGTPTRRDGRDAMLLAPLAALPLAATVLAVLALARWAGAPTLAAGFGCVGVLAYGTRGMHLDGLADTVDGFGAGWTRERAFQVMKAGDVGPMGVAALIVALGIQAACFGALSAHPVVAAGAVVLSRTACAILAATRWAPARPDGLGALVAGTVPTGAAALETLLLGTAWIAILCVAGHGPWAGIVGVSAFAAALVWLGRRATRVLGGVTGDIFGAGVEIALTVLLIGATCGGWS